MPICKIWHNRFSVECGIVQNDGGIFRHFLEQTLLNPKLKQNAIGRSRICLKELSICLDICPKQYGSSGIFCHLPWITLSRREWIAHVPGTSTDQPHIRQDKQAALPAKISVVL